ncbi:hypothetical protein HPB52_010328 [Rhipicephalus sanguineus]|uniref:Uncharacterized protein n=1 Tax=Rhipicephalus sanguineus TaxID=34632 RepID=A0A9D4SUR2_RHISA|nr:hypothetical protein HPB52_010328 [Rhipicephalus sanguineus]
MLRVLSRCIVPSDLHRRPPAAVRGPRRLPLRGHVRTVTIWAVLNSANPLVAWISRLPRELRPRPLTCDPPLDALRRFHGLLSDPSRVYMAEETRILCPLCRVPEISRCTHQDGPLHRSRLLAVTIHNCVPQLPPSPLGPTSVEAAVTLLRSAHPGLLAQGALLAPISASP